MSKLKKNKTQYQISQFDCFSNAYIFSFFRILIYMLDIFNLFMKEGFAKWTSRIKIVGFNHLKIKNFKL